MLIMRNLMIIFWFITYFHEPRGGFLGYLYNFIALPCGCGTSERVNHNYLFNTL